MVKQFGIEGRVCLTTERLTDDTLAWSYSAADVMLATSCEGWGLPAMEALGCGLPVVGTTYAGSAEFTPKRLQVMPTSYSLENPFLVQRPLYDIVAVADKVESVLRENYDRTGSLLDPKYEWDNLWPKWKEWLKAGL